MTWFKLDDRFFDNPKIAALSDRAKVSYLEGGTFCARELTDGFIPLQKARGITGSSKALKELTPHLWEPVPGGFRVHDYLRYNPTREQVMAERTEKHEAKVRAGRAGATARWGDKEDDSGIAEPIAAAIKTMAENSSTDSKKHSPVKPVSPSLSRNPGNPAPADPLPLAAAPPADLMVSSDPNNIFREAQRMLNRQLTAVECDSLREIEREHPEETWRYAIREAAELNKRSVRYVQRICERKSNGDPDEPTGPNPRQPRRPAGANGLRPSDKARRAIEGR